MRKRVSLIVVILFIAATVVLAIQSPEVPGEGATGGVRHSQEKSGPLSKDAAGTGIHQAKPEAGKPDVLNSALGEDDGFACAIFYAADLMGNLETCGCPKHPLGGVARRQGFITEYVRRYPQVPHLHLDAGHLFGERFDPATKQLSEDVALGNQWVIRALDRMQVAAANLTYLDLPQLDLSFAPNLYTGLAGQYPTVNGMISANVRAIQKEFRQPEPFVIREITGPRLPRPLRVGILGLTEQGSLQSSPRGYVVDEPVTAARDMIPKLRPKCDLLIVLAYMSPSLATRIAQENPETDIVLVANRFGYIEAPLKQGRTKVLQCMDEGKEIGELRIYVDEKGRVMDVGSRSIELGEAIPDHAGLAAVRDEARSEISLVQDRLARVQALRLESEKPKPGSEALPAKGTLFTTAGGCQGCHETEYKIWQDSRHAHAFATLQRVKRENEQSCIGCHVTGFGESTGYVNIFTTPGLKDVQCEDCHTAGSTHVSNPVEPYGKVSMPEKCVSCHNQIHDPDFNLAEYWAKIKH